MDQICLASNVEKERADRWRHALYLSDMTGASMHDALGVRNITLVLSILPNDVSGPVVSADSALKYWRSPPIPDEDQQDAATALGEIFDYVIARIDAVLSSGSSALLHCQTGVCCSATLAVAYVMRKLGVDREDALKRVKLCRSSVYVKSAFWEVLGEYEGRAIKEKVLEAERYYMSGYMDCNQDVEMSEDFSKVADETVERGMLTSSKTAPAPIKNEFAGGPYEGTPPNLASNEPGLVCLRRGGGLVCAPGQQSTCTMQ